ncbi:HepT-like ribonuclease domain-containing protein [Paraburkholderia diazotrophica]|uniref:Uncharacterized conserved protein, contains HEPN domain n=1 Tax=Paraburkholderia diazotrophica TaxID=667676 RepID=A0A1H6TPJ3_9BURK|nr:HepT-like ribonuclease domain-containing protein [Paraburkholderia diazotrophica]SEI80124.1 Uncharacterized conserved protein, contains HEPN domain [Paraburkholderia diazotrophica]
MKRTDQRVADRLDRMLEAMARIGHYTEDMTGDMFRVDSLVQDAVIYNLGIVGKVASDVERIQPDFAATHAHVRWKHLRQTCDRIVHDYFSFDADLAWQWITRELPVLKEQLAQIRRQTS